MKFLIVDDSRLARATLREVLEELGHEIVGEAVDGLEAEEQYAALSPEGVVMDIEMPRQDGVVTTKKLLEKDPNALVIIVSSIVNKSLLTEVMGHGAKGVVHKPVKKEALFRCLQTATR